MLMLACKALFYIQVIPRLFLFPSASVGIIGVRKDDIKAYDAECSILM
jgi:hypothetical protein